jgi:CRP-like cAMP-binding protein
MTIFFTASHRGESLYKKQFDLVHSTIQEFKSVTLISPGWNDNYDALLSEAKRKKIDDPHLREYAAIKQGIKLADAVIIETSFESFQLGHETTLALMEKKPVLCLSLHENFSHRIQHDYFFGARYSPASVKGIIQDFLAEVHDLSLSQRFNLFLYPHQLSFLEIQSQRQGMNKSEYIRSLINLDKRNTST